jgi:hypothetical protein
MNPIPLRNDISIKDKRTRKLLQAHLEILGLELGLELTKADNRYKQVLNSFLTSILNY